MNNSELDLGGMIILTLAWISLGVWNINDKLKEILKRLEGKK